MGNAQREVKPLSKEEEVKVQEKILALREELGFKIGDPITYEIINKAHKWALARFRYKSDGYLFDKEDYWNPLAFYWLLLDGYVEDDCDGYGYTILGMLYYVLLIKPERLFRASCYTETREGHFVAWVKTDDDIYYQVENRVRQPRSLRYMRDLGYEYLYFSSMSPRVIKPNKWFDAKKKVASIIYDTPAGLKADTPTVTMKSLIDNSDKSDTLKLGSGVLGSGGIVATITGILTNLSGHTDWRVVALVGGYAILAFIGIYYVRGITSTPLFLKQGRHNRADEDGFVG